MSVAERRAAVLCCRISSANLPANSGAEFASSLALTRTGDGPLVGSDLSNAATPKPIRILEMGGWRTSRHANPVAMASTGTGFATARLLISARNC
jgi:hypothetical protein